MLPSLATIFDVEARNPDLDVDGGQVVALLADASAMVRAVAARTWVNEDNELADVPDGVVGVVSAMVARALHNPAGVTQETTGPFNVSYGNRAADRLYLTRLEKQMLRGGSQQAFTVSTVVDEATTGPDWWTSP